MLSYDWIKIIFSIVGVILVWTFVFSVTATNITNTQQFTVYSYRGNNALAKGFYTTFSEAFSKDKIFSYEIIEPDYYDFATIENEADTVLSVRTDTSEGDVIFLSPAPDLNTKYTDETTGETKYSSSYKTTFVQYYYDCLYHFDKEAEGNYFQVMEEYISQFFDGDWKANDPDREKTDAFFRNRIKKNKDKRYKKASQIERGLQEEYERIVSYKNALLETYKYLEEGLLVPVYETVTDLYRPETTYSRAYTLNICPDESKMENLKNIISYPLSYLDENGKIQWKNSTKDMQVAFFKYDDVEEGFACESLLYLNYVVRASLTQTA